MIRPKGTRKAKAIQQEDHWSSTHRQESSTAPIGTHTSDTMMVGTTEY
ncbi:hypothetical protein BRADI_5g05095v3 [Brachypodium distachyon]|uniref:Uncharacterized protein n=1 Tax=Brachypodium distachyon TaxID=15368 RepID=A0A2K2CFJ3_BRADI|nr:hypothetical protein BRADI_5g05095v3 [Brachypodium distachyon]